MKKYPVIIIFLITMLLVCGETVMAKERLGKPLGVLANGVEDRVVISWEPVKKADGYEVFEKAEGEKAFSKVKVTKKRKLVLKKKFEISLIADISFELIALKTKSLSVKRGFICFKSPNL